MFKKAVLCLGVLSGLAQPARSAIVLSIAPSAPGPVALGSSVDFTVHMRSDSGDIGNLAMLGFTLSVSPGGGQFVSGAGLYTPGSHQFFGPPPTGTLPASLVGYDYAAASGQPVPGATPVPLARFRLDTTGASLGSHVLSLSAADAADIGFNSLGARAPAPFAYSIAAAPVPEPAAWLLMSAGVAALLTRRRLALRPR